ncbi:MAG: hypothetical protein RLZZ435_3228, partial [Cyanobacteriota bacterium]
HKEHKGIPSGLRCLGSEIPGYKVRIP